MKQVGLTIQKNCAYQAALYLRLSKDDEGVGESASIVTQRKMLREYARENKIAIYDEYVDDGYSGTNFERPDFQRMIRDIEQKKINMVITKDLSRLGRDYILTGQYTEIYFPSKRVRYIAINDGYDSDSPHTDIAPFKNIINEMYARDISKKIRSAFQTKMREGEFIGAFAPYGYQRDPQNKNHLIVDPAVSANVVEIFEKAANGVLPIAIAKDLNLRGIPSPIVYRCSKYPNMNANDFSKRQEWTSSGITKILRNMVYIGTTAQGKTSKVSFKSKVSVRNDRDAWYTVEDTHEALISREIFDLAGKRSHQRRCAPTRGFQNIFSGIAKCADCGRNMSTVGTRKKGSRANLACGGYKSYGSQECENHFIDYDTLYHIVLCSVQEAVHLSHEEENCLLETVDQLQKKKESIESEKKKIKSLQKRERELDSLIEKLYEDQIAGILSEERMQKLIRKYEEESRQIKAMLEEIQEPIEVDQATSSMAQLRKLLREMTGPKELTTDLLFRLIDRIEIGQGVYEKTEHGKIKRQTIQIYFRFSGIPMQKTYNM